MRICGRQELPSTSCSGGMASAKSILFFENAKGAEVDHR